MSTQAQTRNDPAERLRYAVERVLDWAPTAENALGETMPADLRLEDVDNALAAERRATVERMVDLTSEHIEQGMHPLDAHHKAARTILDEEAQR